MVQWCLWWLNGIPGTMCRWRLLCTGANHQKKALSTRARDNGTDELLSSTPIALLVLERTPDCLWSFLVTLVFSWLNLFVYVLKIILTALPACIASRKKLKSVIWHAVTNGNTNPVLGTNCTPLLFTSWHPDDVKTGRQRNGWHLVLLRWLCYCWFVATFLHRYTHYHGSWKLAGQRICRVPDSQG